MTPSSSSATEDTADRSPNSGKSRSTRVPVAELLENCLPWVPGDVPEDIPHGDMPGDQVRIEASHQQKAAVIFPGLVDELIRASQASRAGRAVVAVAGGSGVGKSEIASVLSHHLRTAGVGSYTLSGDNYPWRIPRLNDAERRRVFRQAGISGLIAGGLWTTDRGQVLRELLASDADASKASAEEYPWLSTYQSAGRGGLRGYLGTFSESDFVGISTVVGQFQNGADELTLRRMGREEHDLWYETVDVSDIGVLVIEWTHGMSDFLQGVDVRVFLHSTPAQTLAHRAARARDGALDSPFTTTVLEIEQEMLEAQAKKATIIVSKSGDLLSPEDYRRLAEDAEADHG